MAGKRDRHMGAADINNRTYVGKRGHPQFNVVGEVSAVLRNVVFEANVLPLAPVRQPTNLL